MINSINGHTGFIFDKLVLKFNPVFGNELKLGFFDPDDFLKSSSFLKEPYTTLLIGPNGTGKSLILKIIADIILDLNAYKKATPEKISQVRRLNNDYFYLCYYNQGSFYEIQNFDENSNLESTRRKFVFKFRRNGISIDIKDVMLPERLLVSSLLLTDRFTVLKETPDFYKYLGVRSLTSPSTARTRNYVKRTVEHVVNSFADLNTEIAFKIRDLLRFLDFKDTFTIYYFPKYKDKFFDGNLTAARFQELFENYNHKELGFSMRESSDYIPFGVGYYRSKVASKHLLIDEIVNFLNDIKNSGQLIKEDGSRSEFFEYDVLKGELSVERFRLLTHLAALDLISFPSIGLVKNDDYLDIDQASSGEYHFLATMIGLYASLDNNSLILIDEPEVSLHPNWQMKYISFLKYLFQENSNCHFIIASHSHFFASDLEGQTSTILGLRPSISGVEKVDLIRSNTYGWSAEQILFEVFKVPTTRNYFISEKVGEVLELISKKDRNEVLIRKRVEELITSNIVNLSSEDPLKAVIEKLVEKYG